MNAIQMKAAPRAVEDEKRKPVLGAADADQRDNAAWPAPKYDLAPRPAA